MLDRTDHEKLTAIKNKSVEMSTKAGLLTAHTCECLSSLKKNVYAVNHLLPPGLAEHITYFVT